MSPSSEPSSSPRQGPGLEIRPFRALTYRQQDPAYLARVSSPAYDLVSPASRDRLADADPHNVVRLILPRVDPEHGNSTQLAASTLRAWQDHHVLERDAVPALWLYDLAPGDGSAATSGWLGAVALPPPDSTAVVPHEDTFPDAVEGRRALLAATGTDLEPIVLAHDPEPALSALAESVRRVPATLELTDADAVRHRLWRVTEPGVVTAVREALGRTRAVIADGHHRFAAARAHARAQHGADGSDAVLALLTPMGAGGLRVDPIHRVLPGLTLPAALASAAEGFVTAAVPVEDGDPTVQVAAAARRWLGDPAERGFLLTDGRDLIRLTAPSAQVRDAVPAEAPPAWRELDVVLAHHGLIGHLWGRPDSPGSVVIAHGLEEALREAARSDGIALLLRAPSPTDVATVARAGARMPRKSTLFVPKPRTGLVFRPLAD
ncbi:DUF1015 family protein [Blastococcus sp. LR1]|uniref:DUF1015 family protein n=1 Tax=Blastococcus sp. LR1 TaxID=2877000 RepID=UPI001CCBEFCA|nr:DUF1015 domain-containing protein [Blastococcus sp. LR1]MCA0145639.1 DUF1015 domain-containing protein [Blastococcus sp. LR1]